MTRYVIVGGSAGAIGGVEGVRKLDPTGEITVVTEEAIAPYSRPAIGEYLDGRADLNSVLFWPPDFWEKYNVRLMSGKSVVSLDLKERAVALSDGSILGFDKLLLATGGRPFVPKMEGTDREGFYTFMGLRDVERIREEAARARRAVVVGGGLIGVEVAEALVNLGVDVVVVELRGWLLNLLLDREAAGIVESAMESRGVKLVVGESIREIVGREGNERHVGGVVLSSGNRIECDLVVSAVGVIPRTELAVQAGLKVNRGILVDESMQTSAPGVYASGDVAEAYELDQETRRVFAVWPLARLGGRVAGENMAGGRTRYPGGVAMSGLRYFGIPVISMGIDSPETTGEFEVLRNRTDGSYRKIVLRDNRIVGFTLIRGIEGAGLFHNLLRRREDVSEVKAKLLSPDFGFAHLPERVRKRTLMEAWA